MTSIGRLLVRGALAAGAVSITLAIALAPQAGFATTRTLDESAITTHHEIRSVAPAPSAACVSAKNAFIAALKADVAEDATERNLAKTGTNTNDATEDQAEHANFRSLISAMVKACDPDATAEHNKQKPAPTAACTSAKAALKSFFTQRAADEKADWASGTEGTAADKAEDMAAWAQQKTLFQAVASACGFSNTFDHDGFSH